MPLFVQYREPEPQRERRQDQGPFKPMALRTLDTARRALAREMYGSDEWQLCQKGYEEVLALVSSHRCPHCLLVLDRKYHCRDCDRQGVVCSPQRKSNIVTKTGFSEKEAKIQPTSRQHTRLF